MDLVLIDNYDSFTYNLMQYFIVLGAKVNVFRNDEININDKIFMKAQRIVISPGPKRPENAGISKDLIKFYKGKIPILGVCLGMQAINEVYGGKTDYAPMPLHGKKSKIRQNMQSKLFYGLPEEFFVARYHSLIIKNILGLNIDAVTIEDNLPMAISDENEKIYGVQFHPESFLSEYGYELLDNFLKKI